MKREHLPACRDDMMRRGWKRPEIVLVTGDAYIDHPAFPAALLARWLEAHGFRVCVLSRPDVNDPEAFVEFGRPELFFGVTAGALDSMVANYTALKKVRNDDAYAPGGKAGGRPDRAVTAYGNAIRRRYGKSVVIVAGGIEASLRRFAHYDYWSDGVRRPLLMDCGADFLVHGMGEGPILALADTLRRLRKENAEFRRTGDEGASLPIPAVREAVKDIFGLVHRVARREPVPENGVALPSAEAVGSDPAAHVDAFRKMEIHTGRRMWQEAGGMRVIANPPWPPLSSEELDRLYALPFTRDPHPITGNRPVPAMEQVRFSVTSHRGCFGGCAFCAITMHQGKLIASRSPEAMLSEIDGMVRHPDFKGVVNDLGGPSANMYGMGCGRDLPCARPSCLWPEPCRHLKRSPEPYRDVLERAASRPGVRRLFVTTGIRMDLALDSTALIRDLSVRHTSGRMKVAPEHVVPEVLDRMRKCGPEIFERFRDRHDRIRRARKDRQYLSAYLMAAHPGCRLEDMIELAVTLRDGGIRAEQCQIFTPTPGTLSTVMYATGLDPRDGRPVFVEREPERKALQKALILSHLPESAPAVRKALRIAGRSDLEKRLLFSSGKHPKTRRRRKPG